jgi:hypothetical protein
LSITTRGLGVALGGLRRLAGLSIVDRLGLHEPLERAGFTVTRPRLGAADDDRELASGLAPRPHLGELRQRPARKLLELLRQLAGDDGVAVAERFRGVRIFDISDLRKPRQVAAVQTCRGSHTHTLVSDPDDKENVYVYGSGTSAVRSGEELAGCSGLDPKEDPNTALFSIDVIQVPLAAPQNARIVNRPASAGALPAAENP